jgi:hypothetical protein
VFHLGQSFCTINRSECTEYARHPLIRKIQRLGIDFNDGIIRELTRGINSRRGASKEISSGASFEGVAEEPHSKRKFKGEERS